MEHHILINSTEPVNKEGWKVPGYSDEQAYFRSISRTFQFENVVKREGKVSEGEPPPSDFCGTVMSSLALNPEIGGSLKRLKRRGRK